MAQKQSDDSRYESRYGGGFVTPAQAIAEIMCERLAKKNKKDLPIKFWNLPTWKKPFLLQVLAANTLLKLYKPKSILAALRKAPTVYSLRAAWLDDIIQEEEDKINEFEAKQEKVVDVPPPVQLNTTEKPRESFVPKKSTLNKLRELD